MPEGMTIPQLDEMDHRHFMRLTAQESYTVEGQKRKLAMVEEMIWERWEARKRRIRGELMERGLRDRALEDELGRRVQKIYVRRFDLGDGRYNLIVEKRGRSSGQDKKPFTVMVPAHVDTVKGHDSMLNLQTDETDSDRYTGLGVFDMGAGVLNGIHLAATTEIPDDMIAYFVFTVDEEKKSDGANALVDHWQEWPNVDVVVSNEIGPNPLPVPGDKRIRYADARKGRAKFVGRVHVEEEGQGHGAMPGVANASRAMAELLWKAEERFYALTTGKPGGALAAPHDGQHDHPVLGKEVYEWGVYHSTKDEGYVPPDQGAFELSFQLVDDGVEEMLARIRRIFTQIAAEGQWGKFHIEWSLNTNPTETSYDPYCMPDGHPVTQVIRGILERIAGVAPLRAPAPSVADETIYAKKMREKLPGRSFEGAKKGVYTIPPEGDYPHNEAEFVLKSGIARSRFALKLLLEDPAGFASLQQTV